MIRLALPILFVTLAAVPGFAQAAPGNTGKTMAGATTGHGPEAGIAPADQPSAAEVREYLALMRTEQQMKDVVAEEFTAMQATGAPYIPVSFWNDLRQSFQSADIITPMIPVVQRHISRADLQAIIAFYHTDAGQHLLASQPAINADMKATFQAVGEKLGEEVGARHADEIAAARQAYEDRIRSSGSTGGIVIPVRPAPPVSPR